MNQKPNIYLVLSRSESNRSYKKMLWTEAGSSNIYCRIKDRTDRINRSDAGVLVEVELLRLSCFKICCQGTHFCSNVLLVPNFSPILMRNHCARASHFFHYLFGEHIIRPAVS